MSEAHDHYERLLGPIYTWMTGGDDGLAASRRQLDDLGIGDGGGAAALDLGAGSGLPAIPLAERGWRVTAVDTSETLVAELRARAKDLPIDVVLGDLVATVENAHDLALITCTGDTLTHLEDAATVMHTIDLAAHALAPGGRLVLAWRDLTTLPLGDARFFVVKHDETRTLTCFLEELDAARVRVHDLVHAGGALKVSSYVKLRLDTAAIDTHLLANGLSIEKATFARGMITRVARR
jgi:SAM-dependent methyltransferase